MRRSELHPTRRGRRLLAVGSVGSLALAGALVPVSPAAAVSPDVVISEVYGGGGNTGATLTHDFVELFNRGNETVVVTGWSVQYASATGTSWQVTPLVGQIPPGESYLVQEAAGAAGSTPLPTPDVAGTIAMSGTAGKVALVTATTPLTCGADCDTAPDVRDFVGYGTTANDFEGSGPTGSLTNTTSASRSADRTDTDDNSADFTTGAPTPDSCGEVCVDEPPPPPDPTELAIFEIQGVGHLSDDEGDLVETTGVVTAVSANGYWIQDAGGDGDRTTSDGVFVFAGSSGPKPAIGDEVAVTGTVDEFRPGSATGPGLNITEITGSTFDVIASGVALPEPVVIGPGGVQAPADVIDNDSPTRIDIEVAGTYEPAEDAIDFYEQFEGMLLQLDRATAVGPTNGFGEVVVLPPGRHGYVRTVNGGVVYGGYDQPNPRRLLLDDLLIGPGNMPLVNTGDDLVGPIVGPLDYGFNNYRLYPKSVPGVIPGDTVREVTREAAPRELAVATFNVENLDPSDDPAKFDQLASIIVENLQSPDLVTLEEVQDDTGSVNDGTVSADQTLGQLAAAIAAAGGPAYEWRQIDPEDNQDGGEPGGNIRVAFLFRTDRGLEFVDRPGGTATTPTAVVVGPHGEPQLSASPGRIDPQNTAWASSRKPLVGEFTWRGETVFVVANHFNSKGGDEPLFGRYQPPTRSSEVQRHQQAAAVNDFVDDILAIDAAANVVVAGDINDFEFSETIDILTEGGTELIDLVQYLRPRERYTYVFDGNSQVLDHLLVSPGLLPEGWDAGTIRGPYDIVHVNADFADQASDHDPQVVRLRPQATP